MLSRPDFLRSRHHKDGHVHAAPPRASRRDRIGIALCGRSVTLLRDAFNAAEPGVCRACKAKLTEGAFA